MASGMYGVPDVVAESPLRDLAGPMRRRPRELVASCCICRIHCSAREGSERRQRRGRDSVTLLPASGRVLRLVREVYWMSSMEPTGTEAGYVSGVREGVGWLRSMCPSRRLFACALNAREQDAWDRQMCECETSMRSEQRIRTVYR